IIYRSQATPGFEADRWRLMSYDRATGVSKELTQRFDQQVEEVALSPDGSSIYFTAGEHGRNPIFRIPSSGGVPTQVVKNVYASGLGLTSNGQQLVFLSSSNAAPAEVYRANADGSGVTALSSAN